MRRRSYHKNAVSREIGRPEAPRLPEHLDAELRTTLRKALKSRGISMKTLVECTYPDDFPPKISLRSAERALTAKPLQPSPVETAINLVIRASDNGVKFSDDLLRRILNTYGYEWPAYLVFDGESRSLAETLAAELVRRAGVPAEHQQRIENLLETIFLSQERVNRHAYIRQFLAGVKTALPKPWKFNLTRMRFAKFNDDGTQWTAANPLATLRKVFAARLAARERVR